MEKFWQPYESSEKTPWNLPRVWMLHRRAGFGATWQQLKRDQSDGPQKSVARLIDGTSREEDSGFEEISTLLLKQAVASQQILRLSAWWILRMYRGSDPFAERRTLMWHNHFATSNATIQNLFRMYRQNQLFREHGIGKFKTLFDKVIKDPAMLVWLNANDNRQGHPNENLGRELLELFSLGEGNYTEDDVKEAARSLAGWTVNDMVTMTEDPIDDPPTDTVMIRDYWQDPFYKTVLGKTGNWDGDDLLKIVLEHPATSKRLAWRICDELFGENVVSNDAIIELAAGMAERKLDLSWAFNTVLNSQLFFSNANLKSRIAPPETFVLGALIAMETASRPASTLALADVFTSLGRSLFQPPNVGGWDGGRVWLNARTLVARSNFVDAVIRNGMNRNAQSPDFNSIVDSFDNNQDVESVAIQFVELLLGLDRDSETGKTIARNAAANASNLSPENRWAATVNLLLNSSSAHLC